MNNLNTYITEKLKINSKSKTYDYEPKTKDELKEVINKILKEKGKDANLNNIYVGDITDFSWLFEFTGFCGDVSEWDMGNAITTKGMFAGCEKFDGDLGNWDVKNISTMDQMFADCTEFTGKGLEKWNVQKYTRMIWMFSMCPNINKPSWYK